MPDIQDKIQALKKEKDAVILAHYYQTMDIQNIADYVGDSFELAKCAQQAGQSVIVVCGVRFMAESAKILNPEKTVLQPVPDAGCPMADMVSPDDIRALRSKNPDAAVMCYVNSSAAVKAECDICFTSSSAVKIAKSLAQKRIIIVPDQNLGAYVASQVPDREFILFSGFCPAHHHVSTDDVLKARRSSPDAKVLVHPECPPGVLQAADFIGSTAEILRYVETSREKEFVIGTEAGIVERLMQTAPDKRAVLLSTGLVCEDMKKTRIQDVLCSLEHGVYEIRLSIGEQTAARACLERMTAVR